MKGNKYTYLVLLGAVLLAILLFPYSNLGKEEQIKNYPSEGTDIIAFGDSLVYGTGASAKDKNFVSVLSKEIGKPIINLGVPGNTTADGLSRLQELDRYHPKVVLILLGGNDYLKDVPREVTFKNLGKIIEDIQARGAAVVLLGIRGGVLNDRFAPEFKALKEKYQTAYVSDVLSGLLIHIQYMHDAVHPNDTGYKMIADRIYPVLSKLLR